MLVDIVGGPKHTVGPGLIGRTRQHHETKTGSKVIGGAEFSVGPGDKRVIGLKWNKDRAAAPLGHEIKAVIEKLTEESHPGIKRSRQACVGRYIFEKEYLPVISRAEDTIHAGTADNAHTVFQDVVPGMKQV